MGSQCCSEQEEVNPYSKKLIRASFMEVLDKKGNPSSNKQGIIKIYDVENGVSNTFPVKFSYFKTLDSVSQLSVGNFIFLCGEQGSFDSGSAFIRFDIAAPVKSVTILVNSIFRHFKPSMCNFKKDFIITAGGKNNLNCEIFHKTSNKWRKLAELPEERYGAALVNDDLTDSVYLIGGYNSTTKSYCKTVLKLNLKTGVNWETILVTNSTYISRAFFAIVNPQNTRSVFIFGGQTEEKPSTTDIVEYDFHTKTAALYDYSLNKPSSFDTNTVAEFDNNMFIKDDDNIIHKISRREAKCELIIPNGEDRSSHTGERLTFHGEGVREEFEVKEEKISSI